MSLRQIDIDYTEEPASRVAAEASVPWFVYLDSCAARSRGGRYDIISAAPRVRLLTLGAVTQISGLGETIESTRDPFALVHEALAERPSAGALAPFCGGALGYFSYDLGRRIEGVADDSVREIDIPDMAIGIYDWAAVYDHKARRAWIVVQADCAVDVQHWANLLCSADPLTPAAFATNFQVTSNVAAEMTHNEYAERFARIKRYITDGDCYQVNLAQRFSAGVTGDPWDAYLRLRNLNPAPYSAYLALDNGAILSSSPERFLSVNKGAIETKPIKGTRPRASDPTEDARLAEELRCSEKDRAENLMIVDLLRNDLGKSCRFGSVAVPDLFKIESFATVHHLVSTVRGELGHGKSTSDLLRGCFPGGSITGAPKRRAMEIIEELELCRRTIYCGSIGYLSFDGRVDSNIAIRTLVVSGERMYCWAGGGIVADSKLDEEYQECLDKAAAMLDVFVHAQASYVDP